MNRQTITRQNADGDIEIAGWFDTDRARAIHSDKDWNGQNHIDRATRSQWDHELLYRTAGGKWVHHWWSQRQGSTETYHYISDDDARAWCLRALDPGDELEGLLSEYWPGLPDEVQYGRPVVGPQVQVRMSDEMRDACDEAADLAGVSRAEWIRRVLADRLGQ